MVIVSVIGIQLLILLFRKSIFWFGTILKPPQITVGIIV